MSSKTILKKRSLEITLLVILIILFIGCLISTIVLAVLYKKEKGKPSLSCATKLDDNTQVCCQADELLTYENSHYQCQKKSAD